MEERRCVKCVGRRQLIVGHVIAPQARPARAADRAPASGADRLSVVAAETGGSGPGPATGAGRRRQRRDRQRARVEIVEEKSDRTAARARLDGPDRAPLHAGEEWVERPFGPFERAAGKPTGLAGPTEGRLRLGRDHEPEDVIGVALEPCRGGLPRAEDITGPPARLGQVADRVVVEGPEAGQCLELRPSEAQRTEEEMDPGKDQVGIARTVGSGGRPVPGPGGERGPACRGVRRGRGGGRQRRGGRDGGRGGGRHHRDRRTCSRGSRRRVAGRGRCGGHVAGRLRCRAHAGSRRRPSRPRR